MPFPPPLRAALSDLLGAPVEHGRSVYGGDINQAARFEAGGVRYFVKWNASAPADMFAAEAHGLRLLAEADAIRVPAVVLESAPHEGCPGFLVLEWIEPGAGRSGGHEVMANFGGSLAALHRHTARQHGLDRDNYIGRLPQKNRFDTSWAHFYRDQRIGFQMELARQRGRLPARREKLLTRLMERIPDLLDDEDIQPSLLHGDLWGGNYMVDAEGEAVLIDPAVFYGHREMDIAMSELFGGFSDRFYDAYKATYSIHGYDDRRLLYQLYYILAHLNLFGESYGGRVDSMAAHYVGWN